MIIMWRVLFISLFVVGVNAARKPKYDKWAKCECDLCFMHREDWLDYHGRSNLTEDKCAYLHTYKHFFVINVQSHMNIICN